MASENCSKCGEPIKPMRGDEPASEWEHHCAAPSRGEGARAGDGIMAATRQEFKDTLINDYNFTPEAAESVLQPQAGEAGQPPAPRDGQLHAAIRQPPAVVHGPNCLYTTCAYPGPPYSCSCGAIAKAAPPAPQGTDVSIPLSCPHDEIENDGAGTIYCKDCGMWEVSHGKWKAASRLSASERLAPQCPTCLKPMTCDYTSSEMPIKWRCESCNSFGYVTLAPADSAEGGAGEDDFSWAVDAATHIWNNQLNGGRDEWVKSRAKVIEHHYLKSSLRTRLEDAHRDLNKQSQDWWTAFNWMLHRKYDEVQAATERAEAAERELGQLQRTVKFMEETYLKEHGGSWGKCQYQSKVEAAEARISALTGVLEELMTCVNTFDYPKTIAACEAALSDPPEGQKDKQ